VSGPKAAHNQQDAEPHGIRAIVRLKDSYALVLIFILLDYIAASVAQSSWGKVVVLALLSGTLLLAFRIARAPRIWVSAAAVFVIASVFAAAIAAAIPGAAWIGQSILNVGGALLILAPFVILRRIAASTYISGETILGAVCVYLLWGMSFAYIFSLVDTLSPGGFFEEQPAQKTASDFLFFSYTTLTTVGYGNLVPGNPLWGQDRPATSIGMAPRRRFRVPRKGRRVGAFSARRRTQRQPGNAHSPDAPVPKAE
jgi:hypothetical protein